ncbi:MAG: hypothetical protein AAF235_01370, partial [Planctomycetota bacterium]
MNDAVDLDALQLDGRHLEAMPLRAMPLKTMPLDADGRAHFSIVVSAIADHRGVRAEPARITLAARSPRVGPKGAILGHDLTMLNIEPAENPPNQVVVIPGMVNAHTHLDLTSIGPRPFDPANGFPGWLRAVRDARPIATAHIRAAVIDGVRRSRAGGVHAVGDIAGAPSGGPDITAWLALRASAMPGVSAAEFFAIGAREKAGIEAMTRDIAVSLSDVQASPRLALSPHAPYSVGLAGYRAAVTARGTPRLITHVAETIEERRFVAEGTGPKREFLEHLGLWNDDAAADVGHGLSPVQHLELIFERTPARWLVAHVNDAGDEDIAILARHAVSVAYCPRASTYFG